MDTKIYDRLLEIHLEVDIKAISSPQYINEKTWECHRYIEEIERYNIQTSKEISVIQQALNNAQSYYESQRELILTKNPEVIGLLNIKDREAKTNTLLRPELERIKNYQNELTDLNNLLKATNLKIKNLNRANSDIKMQLRVIEAQIRLGSGSMPANPAMEKFIEEMGRTDDLLKAVAASTEITSDTVDPSVPLDVNSLLKQEPISANITEPIPDIDPESDEEEIDQEDEPWVVEESSVSEIQETKEINLDEAIEPQTTKGGDPQIIKEEPVPKKETPTDEPKKEVRQNKIGLDLDDLLDSLNL